MTVADAAKAYGVSEQTVRRAARDGSIRHTRIRRRLLIAVPADCIIKKTRRR